MDWTLIGDVYSNQGQTYQGKTATNLWSPEVHKVNGQYYLYCTYLYDNGAMNDKDVVVVPGSSPTSFDANSRVTLVGDDTVDMNLYIDPTFFQDTDGSMYLYYKMRNGPGSYLYGRPMSTPTTPSGPGVQLLNSDNVVNSEGILEHPEMYVRNGHYIFFYSYGTGSTTTYKIGYATSSSPLGTFTQAAGNPIVFTNQSPGVIAPGAISIVTDGSGADWAVYRQKIDTGNDWKRVVCLDPITITDTGVVTMMGTRNTYVHKPVPLVGSNPADPPQTRVEDTSSQIAYTGTWTQDNKTSDSGGSTHTSATAGNKAQLTFYGTSIKVGARSGINSGIVDIRLDGTIVADNVDTYSNPPQYQQLVYVNDTLAEGTHTISFEPTGTKNASSGQATARLDFFDYSGPTVVDSSSASLTYSGTNWSTYNDAGDYGGSVKSSTVAGEYMQYTFTGTNVKLFARKAPAAGMVDIYLDGVLVVDNYDLYNATIDGQVNVYDSGILAAGSHTVKYEVTGSKNASSSGYGNNFDFLTYAP